MSDEKTRGPRKIANGIVALSSAAVLSVYAAGYARTRSAAERLEQQSSERRPPVYIPASSSAPVPFSAPDNVKEAVKADVKNDGATKPIQVSSLAPPHQTGNVQNAAVSPVAASPSEVPTAAPLSAPKAAEPSVVAPVEIAATVPSNAAPSAPANVAPPTPASNAAAVKWNDGRYLGWGTSRHGDIQAAVVIEGGRIVSATIADCRTRYSCDVIEKLPPEVAQRQSPEVDYVSGATQSTNAFYYAVIEALGQARVR
jgi:uncharacterized protein with FMN-binding domain